MKTQLTERNDVSCMFEFNPSLSIYFKDSFKCLMFC